MRENYWLQKKDKENRLAILISDLKAGERLRNSDIKFLKELGLYIEDDTNKIYYIEDDTNKIYYLEDDRRYPDSLIKLLKNEAEKYDIYNRLPSRRRVLDKNTMGDTREYMMECHMIGERNVLN